MEIRPNDRFAFIQRQVTRARGHFAKVDPGTGIAVGDEVYFNAWKCDQPPIVPKVPRGAMPAHRQMFLADCAFALDKVVNEVRAGIQLREEQV